MRQINTMPAETDTACYCCNRHHRKLYLIDGLWLGENCAENYRNYKINSNVNSIYWHGYEKTHAKVQRMITNAPN